MKEEAYFAQAGSCPKLKSEIGHIFLELMHYLWISKAVQGCCRLHFSSPAHFPFSFTDSLTMRYYGFLMVSVIGQRYITEAINKDNTILRDPQSSLVLLTYIPLMNTPRTSPISLHVYRKDSVLLNMDIFVQARNIICFSCFYFLALFFSQQNDLSN